MHARAYATLMAEYNRWMNQKVYDASSQLTEEERRRDLGAFFRSVHGTLNHIVWADRVFLGRLRGERPSMGKPDDIVHDDFRALWRERQTLDEAILSWAGALEDQMLEAPFEFGNRGKVPTYVIAVQMFNHQTHHRGQTTVLLHRLGKDLGSTDIPWMPHVQAMLEASKA
jgi:uncharacterized damage-inducible protein DinB